MTDDISPHAHALVAKLMGAHVDEIVSVERTDAGGEIRHIDGSTYVLVGDDSPDAAGKTGLMYRHPPCDNYAGTFPVYAPHARDMVPADDVADTLDDAATDTAAAKGDAKATDAAAAKTAATPPETPAAGAGPAVPVKKKAKAADTATPS